MTDAQVKHSPRVSVIMPVYNSEQFLEPAVMSILSQTFTNFELIVVDDGSTDSSLKILRGFADGDDRVRIFSRPNTGYVIALNEMIDAAAGEYLARMDADDIALPSRLQTQVDYLDAHPDIVCVGTHWEIIDEADRLLHVQKPPVDDETMQQAAMRGATPFCHPSIMVRSEAMRRVGSYQVDMEPAEDLDLALRLGEIGKLANIDVPLMRYRVHSGSVSGTRAAQQIDRQSEAIQRAGKRRGVEVEFAGGDGWRPGNDRDSNFFYHLKYGWWAFKLGESKTASHYAKLAIVTIPWRLGGWRLLWCATFRSPENGGSRQ